MDDWGREMNRFFRFCVGVVWRLGFADWNLPLRRRFFVTIFTPQERRVLLFLLAALLAGSGVKVYRSRHREIGPYPAQGPAFSLPVEVDSSNITKLDTLITLVEQRIADPGPPDLSKNRIDINRASQRELCLLPGIGTKLARRIIQYREEHGSFEKIEQLRNVPGIGYKKLSRIRKMVKVCRTAGSESSRESGLEAE